MTREEMLSRLPVLASYLEGVVRQANMPDDLGLRPSLDRLSKLIKRVLENKEKVTDVELLAFFKTCLSFEELRRADRDLEERKEEVKVYKALLNREELYFSQAFSSKLKASETPLGQVKEKQPLERPTNIQVEPTNEPPLMARDVASETSEPVQIPSPMVYESETETLEQMISDVEHMAYMLPLAYNSNRPRFSSINFSKEEEELYSLVNDWATRATEFVKSRLDNLQMGSFGYCRKYLESTTNMLKCMNYMLNAKDELSVKRGTNALKKGLVDMDKYFGEQPIKKTM